jgi:hypothetical protein
MKAPIPSVTQSTSPDSLEHQFLDVFCDQRNRQREYLDDCMEHARGVIDDFFGEGYAMKNPQLIAAVLQLCGSTYKTDVQIAVEQMRLKIADKQS